MMFVLVLFALHAEGVCTRPGGWCVHAGSEYVNVDCDGDGILDHACIDDTGARGRIASASGCVDNWSSAPLNSCPAAFVSTNYQALGCYIDVTSGSHDLTDFHGNSQTPGSCSMLCSTYRYFGVQNGGACYCGNRYNTYGQDTSSGACSLTCTADGSQYCGGTNSNSVYAQASPQFSYIGCYADSSTRDLPTRISGTHTRESCSFACAGYLYFSIQAGSACFCGNAYGQYGQSSACTQACDVGAGVGCGGYWANSVYSNQAFYVGCYADGTNRVLPTNMADGGSNIGHCAFLCNGYNYFGLQAGGYCFCGNTYDTLGTSTACTATCSGFAGQNCGGSWANAVYKRVTPVGPTYIGCYADQSTRDLNQQFDSLMSVTVQSCRTYCNNYLFFGLQAGTWCFCGNRFGTYGTANNCTQPCSANSQQTCGNSWANNVYAVDQYPVEPTGAQLVTTPVTYGQSIFWSFTIQKYKTATPTGSVDFKAPGRGAVSILLSYPSGIPTATYTWTNPTLPAGSSNIAATYTGDAYFDFGISTVAQVVNKATPTITLTASTTTPLPLQTFSLTITLSATAGTYPSGGVEFWLAGSYVTAGTLSGTGTCTVTGLNYAVGTYSWTGKYNGNSNFNIVTSSPLTITVVKATPNISLTVDYPGYGNALTLQANLSAVSGVYPTGSVEFYKFFNSRTTLLTTGTLNGTGVTTWATYFSITFPDGGTYSLTAKYLGDGNFNQVTSSALTFTQ